MIKIDKRLKEEMLDELERMKKEVQRKKIVIPLEHNNGCAGCWDLRDFIRFTDEYRNVKFIYKPVFINGEKIDINRE